jgi:hypothetical protein
MRQENSRKGKQDDEMNQAIRQGKTSKDKRDKTRRQAKTREFTKR